jgi:Ras-related protein Rab-11A
MNIYKITIIGDSGTGKSSIMDRFVNNKFDNNVVSTIGVEFMTKEIKVNGKNTKLQIWDTAGQERFRAISRSIYHGSKAIIIVYDITNSATFDSLEKWIMDSKIHLHPNTPYFLIGNKIDLEHLRAVKTQTAKSFADKFGMSFLETSAATNQNILNIFEMITKKIIDDEMTGIASALESKISKDSKQEPVKFPNNDKRIEQKTKCSC